MMTNTLQILPLILQASVVVKAVMGILLLLSLISWLIIFQLSAKLGKAVKDDAHFQTQFWQAQNLPRFHQAVSNSDDPLGLAYVFLTSYGEYLTLDRIAKQKSDITDSIQRACRVGLGREQNRLEKGLPTLASIASVSPYIGLFGTVWGIMTAFIGIGEADSVSLATVAPGIAEALVATAMGLFAAIPASLGFNHFSAKSSTLYESRALFCDELTGAIERQYLSRAAV